MIQNKRKFRDGFVTAAAVAGLAGAARGSRLVRETAAGATPAARTGFRL